MVTKKNTGGKKGKVKVGKLKLNKETVNKLTSEEQKRVKGGIMARATKTDGCSANCTP